MNRRDAKHTAAALNSFAMIRKSFDETWGVDSIGRGTERLSVEKEGKRFVTIWSGGALKDLRWISNASKCVGVDCTRQGTALISVERAKN